MKSTNKTANAAPESQAHSFIAQHPDYALEPRAAKPKDLLKWLAEVDGHAQGAARAAYLVGRALVAIRPEHGKVGSWLEEQAKIIDRSARTLRLYMQVAEAVDTDSATPLPISVLDRPLRDIPEAIQAVREGRDPDAQPKKARGTNKTQQWRQRAKNLIKAVPRASRKPLLKALFLATYQELLKLDPSLAPPNDPADVTEFALAAAAELQRGKPLPSDVLAARKKVGSGIPYPGGKSRVVGDIIKRCGVLQADGLRGDHVFREPFVGGGSVMLNMLQSGRAKQVWINDLDSGVVAFWNAIIKEPDHFAKRIAALPEKPTKDTIKKWSEQANVGCLAGLDLAVAEVLLRFATMDADRKSYSEFKVNKQWNPLNLAERVRRHHELLADRVVHGECTMLDAVEVVAAPGPCFTYLDPPYVLAGPTKYPLSFGETDHRRLAKALLATDQPWLLSYDDDPLIRELYAGQVIDHLPVRGSRNKKSELLICPATYLDILRPDDSPDYIRELFGTECGVEGQD